MKKFRISPAQLEDVAPGRGTCLASDKITVDGMPVRWTYREEPVDKTDSGWRFFSGEESEEYTTNPANFEIYDVNTIANYDPSTVALLDSPAGSSFEKPEESAEFVPVLDWTIPEEPYPEG